MTQQNNPLAFVTQDDVLWFFLQSELPVHKVLSTVPEVKVKISLKLL